MMSHMIGSNWGSWEGMPDYMQQMMSSYYGGLRPFSSLFGIFHIVTWILVLALLVALIRYFWKKGGK